MRQGNGGPRGESSRCRQAGPSLSWNYCTPSSVSYSFYEVWLDRGREAHFNICISFLISLADLPSLSSHPSLSGLKNVCVRSLPSSSGILKGSFLMLSYKFCAKRRHKDNQLRTCGLRSHSYFLALIVVTPWGSPWAAPQADHHLHWCHGSWRWISQQWACP